MVGIERLRLTIMALKVREVRVVLVLRFQSFLVGLACRRGDRPELRAEQVPRQPSLLATRVQTEGGA